MKKLLLALGLGLVLLLNGCGDDSVNIGDNVSDDSVSTSTSTERPSATESDEVVEDSSVEFRNVRDAYTVNRKFVTMSATMLTNDDINVFNFLYEIEDEVGDITYIQPNATNDDGRIVIDGDFTADNKGKHKITLFYYGDEEVKITKHTVDV